MRAWIIRYQWCEWTVAQAFKTPRDAYQFGDHICRVWGVEDYDVEYRNYASYPEYRQEQP